MAGRIVYLFGGFHFDEGRGLFSGNTQIDLPPRVRSLLLLLLRSGGVPVPKEDLIAVCTESASNADASLSRAIHLLRKALGDADQKILKTEYGRGLRLTVPVVQRSRRQMPDVDETFRLQALSPRIASGEEMIRTAFELASNRSDQNLRLAGAVLANALERFPTLALAPSLHADIEVSRMIRGYVRPAAHAKQAFALVDKALEITPSLPSALATKGWLTGVILDDRKAGLRLTDEAIDLSPEMWIGRFYKTWLLIGERQLDTAAATLDQALTISPLERALLSLKGWLMCAMGRVDEASQFIDDAISLRPDVDLLWIMQAVSRMRRGDIAGARQSMAEAVTLAPRNTQVQANEAWLNALTDKTWEAQDFLVRRSKSPGTYVLPVKLAMVRRALADEIGATNLLRIAETDKDPWRLLAWCDPRFGERSV